MKKLPHERLREAEGFGDICYYFDYDGDEEYEAYSKIADEIERYYVQIPTDKNGKPWKCGDKCIGEYGEGEVQGYDDEGGVFVEFSERGCVIEDGFYDTCNIERPTTKVLDADGAEITIGSKGWLVDTGEAAEVTDFCDSVTPVEVVTKDGVKWTKPCNFTHREPDSLEKLRDDMCHRVKEGTYPGTAHEYYQ